jgi:hypothetical protein
VYAPIREDGRPQRLAHVAVVRLLHFVARVPAHTTTPRVKLTGKVQVTVKVSYLYAPSRHLLDATWTCAAA